MEKRAATAARYRALLTEALSLAREKARNRSKVIRDILATGTVEGPGKGRDRKYVDHSTAPERADSMIDTVEANVRMTETNSWPKPPARRARSRKKTRRASSR